MSAIELVLAAGRPGHTGPEYGNSISTEANMSVSPAEHGRAAANAEIITSAYEAFGRGDIPAVLETLAEDILWHVPGRGPLSRDYRGHDEVLGFFQHFTELSGGTFQIAVDEVLVKGDRVIVLVTESAERHGRNWSSPQVHAWMVNDGTATVFWQFQGDQQT
jgi:ketosteroid isomerase-like protein